MFSLPALGSHLEGNLWIAAWCTEKHSGVPVRNAGVSPWASGLLTWMILWARYLFSLSLYLLMGNSGTSRATSLDYLSSKYYNKVFRTLPDTPNISKKCRLPSLHILHAVIGYHYSCIKRKIYFVFIHLTIILNAYWTAYWVHDDKTRSSQFRRQEICPVM